MAFDSQKEDFNYAGRRDRGLHSTSHHRSSDRCKSRPRKMIQRVSEENPISPQNPQSQNQETSEPGGDAASLKKLRGGRIIELAAS
jgi:hypothetical protein